MKPGIDPTDLGSVTTVKMAINRITSPVA